MQKVTFTSIFVFLAILAFAQPPQGFKYQSVVRDGTGTIIQNQAIALRMNIRQGSAAGTIVYQEIHSVTTNDFGLASIEIGSETPTIGTFIDIDWGNYDFFLETELDPDNGTSFVSMGTSQLHSVPYALHAGNSGDSYWEISSGDIYYNSGKVGVGTDSPGSQLHLFSTEATSNGLSVGSSGLFPNQQSYLELITLGDGTVRLGDENNQGWHLTGRSALYGNISQRHDLLLSRWNGDDWREVMFFDTTGNIGIGTSKPTSAMEIRGALELGLNTYSIIKTRSDTAQIQLQSSRTPYSGAYLLMNSGERPDDAGSIYFTHGNFTDPAPESLIRFRYANDGVISNQMVITSEGNLGVGTTSPGSFLHLYNTQNTAKGISIGTSGILPGQQSYLELISQGDGTAQLGQPDNIGWHLTARSASYGLVPQQHDLLLSHWDGEDWREMMFFDTTGNVGIGTTSPNFKLDVRTTTELRSGYFYNETNSESATLGLYGGAYGTGSGEKYGGAFDAVGGTGENVGVKAYAADGTSNTALYGSASGGTTNWAGYFNSGNVYVENRMGVGTSPSFKLDVRSSTELRTGYFYNETNSSSSTYGMYSGAFGTGAGNKRGGAFDAVGGTGENVGVKAYAADGTSNIALFGSASGGTTNWAGYFDNGNVYVENRMGIGISPSFKLDVRSSTELRTGYFYNETNSTSSTFGIYGGAFGAGSGNKRGGSFDANGGTGENIGVKGYAANGSSNIGVFGSATGGSTNWAGYFEGGHVYVENNLGIGTSNPTQKLHISGGDIEVNDGFPWIYLDATTSTGNSGIYFQNQNSTGAFLVFNKIANNLILQNETNNHRIILDNNGIGFNTSSPDFDIHIFGDDVSDIAEFYNVNTGTNADVVRAKVNATTPTIAQFYFRCVGGDDISDGGVRADGVGGVFFATSSDRKLKMNIEDFSGALNILDKIQPRKYEMKQAPGISQYGFIAQELNRIYPMAVLSNENSNSEDEPMMIDYSKLTPLLAGATKELHQIVEEQQSEIEQLRKELEEIKKLLK